MAFKMMPLIVRNGEYLANWANLAVKINIPKIEVVIFGPEVDSINKQLLEQELPHCYILGAKETSALALFENRKPPLEKTFIYVCINNTCSLPVETVSEAIEIIKMK
jgi:uncharacterized protein